MARGPRLTTTVTDYIAEVYIEHPDWQARQVQLEVNKHFGQKGPGLSAVQKVLAKYRKQDRLKPNAQDQPWGVESLEDYPQFFPPEALPAILQAWVCAREAFHHALTVRDAKWVARLYAAADLYAAGEHHVGRLTGWAMAHAVRERIPEIAGKKAKAPPWEVLKLYEEMTGEKFPAERESYLLEGYKDEVKEWPFSADRATLESWAKKLWTKKEGTP